MKIMRDAVICTLIVVSAACSSTPGKSVSPAAKSTAPAIANIAGKWSLSVKSRMGTVDGDMSIVQDGKDFGGRLESKFGNIDYTGTLAGNDVRFSYDASSFGMPAGTIFKYTGVIDGDSMKGTAAFGTLGQGEWTAKRR